MLTYNSRALFLVVKTFPDYGNEMHCRKRVKVALRQEPKKLNDSTMPAHKHWKQTGQPLADVKFLQILFIRVP